MGVYINMEIPTTCEKCNLESFCDKWIEARKICGIKATIRHSKCPLLPVQPHGDLIDRDAFGSIKYELPNGQKAFNRGFHNGVQYVQRLLMDAPTIIPADDIDIQKEFIQNWHEEDNE